MSIESYTRLGIFSPILTPEEVDSALGIKCDKSYHSGDLRKPTIIREKKNGWIINSRLPRDASLEDHIKDLLSRVSGLEDKIRELADRPGVEAEFTYVVFTNERLILFFPRKVVDTFFRMGVDLDIDFYILPEDEDA